MKRKELFTLIKKDYIYQYTIGVFDSYDEALETMDKIRSNEHHFKIEKTYTYE